MPRSTMPLDAEHNRPRVEPYCRSSHGTLYFTPRGQSDRRSIAVAPASLPNPLIGPRPRRPHSIHIISYPPGFVPRELRPLVNAQQPSASSSARNSSTTHHQDRPEWWRRGSTSGTKEEKNNNKKKKKKSKSRKDAAKDQSPDQSLQRRPSSVASKPGNKASRVFNKILSFFGSRPASRTSEVPAPGTERQPRVTVQPRSRPVSLLSIGRQLTRIGEALDEQSQQQSMRHSVMVDQPLRPALSTAIAPVSHRNSVLSTMSAKSIVSSSVTEIPKPVATGSGVSCSILLAEPYIFLSGFEHEGHHRDGGSGTALLRGKLVLNVSKNVKLKSVTLKLVGKARTEWPEGIPPLKVDMFEEQSLRTQGLTFFHAMHDGWETAYGNQCTYTLKSSNEGSASRVMTLGRSSPAGSSISVNTFMRSRQSTNLTAKELKRLSLQSVQSRSFGKGDSPLPNQVQLKGYKVFVPGTYEYSFELPIDHHQLETTKLQYGSVKWQLETIIERAGAFRSNLHGAKEVNIVRVPDQLSLETSEPISISRHWEDQLHYDIMISGKSFPIGSKIPIAFKLTPLAKVQVHKIKVFVTESIEYWTNDRRVTRKDMGRKLLLLEKAAGKPVDPQFSRSDITVVRGGELTPNQREGARAAATRRRSMLAYRSGQVAQPLAEPTENILGDLDLGLESYWAATEMEMNVQIPTCEMMSKDRNLRLNPDCSWKNVNVFHWIKIVMRISRADPDDPTGKRRRHFEISIDSPFTVLNCRATHANTALPQYSGAEMPTYRVERSCGCPDAHTVTHHNTSPSSSTGTLPINVEGGAGAETASGAITTSATEVSGATPPALPVTPAAAHLPAQSPGLGMSPSRANSGSGSLPAGLGIAHGSASANPVQRVRDQETGVHPRPSSSTIQQQQQQRPPQPRPIHLIRVPSYNPPPFDAEEAPPPLGEDDANNTTVLMTPPPNYDMIVGTPSVDGLADYFARLADYEDDGSITPPAGPGHAAAAERPSASRTASDETISTETVGSAAMQRRPSADSSEESDEDDGGLTATHRRLTDRSGRVNVANPRTPGGRNVPSRSFDIARPMVQLSMDTVVRRGEASSSAAR